MKKASLASVLAVGAVLFLAAHVVFGQGAITPPDPTQVGICPPGSSVSQCVIDVGIIIMRILLTIAIILAVVLFIVGGILYISSGGNEDKRKKATDYLIWGVIGLVVAFLAFTAVAFLRRYVETLAPGGR